MPESPGPDMALSHLCRLGLAVLTNRNQPANSLVFPWHKRTRLGGNTETGISEVSSLAEESRAWILTWSLSGSEKIPLLVLFLVLLSFGAESASAYKKAELLLDVLTVVLSPCGASVNSSRLSSTLLNLC